MSDRGKTAAGLDDGLWKQPPFWAPNTPLPGARPRGFRPPGLAPGRWCPMTVASHPHLEQPPAPPGNDAAARLLEAILASAGLKRPAQREA